MALVDAVVDDADLHPVALVREPCLPRRGAARMLGGVVEATA